MTKTAKSRRSVNWNDRSVPVSVRKVAYVKWLMRHDKAGLSLREAKLMAYKRFYREEHEW